MIWHGLISRKTSNVCSESTGKPTIRFFEDLADSLIEGDLGAKTAFDIVGQLEKTCRSQGITESGKILDELVLILSPFAKEITLEPAAGKVSVFHGSRCERCRQNDVGRENGRLVQNHGAGEIVLAASDTFRAAAIEQLK